MLAVRSEKMKKFLIVILATICILSNLTASALDELDFNKLFEEAEEAASWFSGWNEYGHVNILTEEQVAKIPDTVPEKITYNGYEYLLRKYAGTKEDMTKYLKTLFSDDIVESLFTENGENPWFVEQNGYLYYLDGSIHQYGSTAPYKETRIGTLTFEKTLDTETKKVYRMSYTAALTDGRYYGGVTEACCTQAADYTVEWNGERWVFTKYVFTGDLFHTPWSCPTNPQTGDNGSTAIITVCALSAVTAVLLGKNKRCKVK